MLGIVGSTDTRINGYIFLRDQLNREHFAHRTGFIDPRIFARAEPGTALSFLTEERPQGSRAWNIDEATQEESDIVAQWEENRGNQ